MTTERDQQAERLAQLKARRNAPVDQRRAVLGKILATGLTSTTVFGITAALGWSATSAATDNAPTDAVAEQLVLDLASGQLVRYVDGVAVSAQQVASPGQLIAAPSKPSAPVSNLTASPAPTLPANWNPSTQPTSPKTVATPAGPAATSTASDTPTPAAPQVAAPVESTSPTVAQTLPTEPAQVVNIPVAVPQPSGSRSGSGGGGGGSSRSS